MIFPRAYPADNIYSMFADADLKFEDAVDAKGETYPLSQGTYVSYMESTDRELRKSAFVNFYRPIGQFRNTLAATLASQVKSLQFFAKARGKQIKDFPAQFGGGQIGGIDNKIRPIPRLYRRG